jgi:hypothetical protein
MKIPKESLEAGYVWAPYTIVNTSTSINGEVVWYKNKWKNFLLKIKHFFVGKPKIDPKYFQKTINQNFYGTIKIENTNE